MTNFDTAKKTSYWHLQPLSWSTVTLAMSSADFCVLHAHCL